MFLVANNLDPSETFENISSQSLKENLLSNNTSNTLGSEINSTGLNYLLLKSYLHILFADIYDKFHIYLVDFFDFIVNFQDYIHVSSFEFKILLFLLACLFSLILFIFVFWRIFSKQITEFNDQLENGSNTNTNPNTNE